MLAYLLASVLALSAADPADPQLAKLLAQKVSPGSVALLVRYAGDPQAIARLSVALHDQTPAVRAAAARVALVGYAKTLSPSLTEALAVEDNAEAAREEIRALVTLAGPDADPQLFAASQRFDGRLDWDIAESMARERGPAAVPALLDDTRLKPTARQWADAVFLAARGDDTLIARALGHSLGANNATRFEALLREARSRHVELDEMAVAAGLRSEAPHVSGTAAWYLSSMFTRTTPRDRAALKELAEGAHSTDVDLAFAFRVLVRALGNPPADDAAWIAWIGDAQSSLADWISPGDPVLQWLTPAERDALRRHYDRVQAVKVDDERADRARWEPRPAPPQRPTPRLDLLQVRTVADLPRGVAASVLAVSGCAAKPGKLFAVAEMRYNPDGRPGRLSPIDMPAGRDCNDAATSLLLLTLAPKADFPIPDRSIALIAISRSDCLHALDEADVCPSVCPVDRGTIHRVGGRVEPPVLQEKVQPTYSEVARHDRIEGPVIVEASITEDGCVRAVRILKRLDPGLDLEAARAVSQWKYRPAQMDGRPISVFLTVTITYSLKK